MRIKLHVGQYHSLGGYSLASTPRFVIFPSESIWVLRWKVPLEQVFLRT